MIAALLQRYITLLTHFGGPATDLHSLAGPGNPLCATQKVQNSRLDGYAIAAVATTPLIGADQAGAVLVTDNGKYAQLRMPGCMVSPLDIPAAAQNLFVSRSGVLLYSVSRADQEPIWWVLPAPSAKSIRVEGPRNGIVSGKAALSSDGKWIAWMWGDGAAYLRSVDQTRDLAIYLRWLKPCDKCIIVDFVEDQRLLILIVDDQLWVGIRKIIKDGIPDEEYGGHFHLNNFSRIIVKGRKMFNLIPTWKINGEDQIAWGVLKEQKDQHVMHWSTPKNEGEWFAPKGKRLSSVAVHVKGDYVALVVDPAYSFDNSPSAISVVNTGDGVLVFNKYVSKADDVQVAFLGPDWLAYSRRLLHASGRVGGHVRVLRVVNR